MGKIETRTGNKKQKGGKTKMEGSGDTKTKKETDAKHEITEKKLKSKMETKNGEKMEQEVKTKNGNIKMGTKKRKHIVAQTNEKCSST